MTINISLPEVGPNLHPVITVIGVGGAGGNAVNNMIRSNLEGVEFLITNTDAQALEHSACERKIQLGISSTKGLGAGMRPDVGRKAAEETLDEIKDSKLELVVAGTKNGVLMVENSKIKSVYRISENEKLEPLYIELVKKILQL